MNPPSALHGAMNKERKPFTYTPGGLDLSQIKSERMAKRLMINAMNQGVPDSRIQAIKSPPSSNIPVAIPNFNCLPVQVFPSFTLPANPKSLLRTRSNPDGSSELNRPALPTRFIDNPSSSSNVNKPSLIPTIKNNNNGNKPIVPRDLNTKDNGYSLPEVSETNNNNTFLPSDYNYRPDYLNVTPERHSKPTTVNIKDDELSMTSLPNVTSATLMNNNNNISSSSILSNNNNNAAFTDDYNLSKPKYEENLHLLSQNTKINQNDASSIPDINYNSDTALVSSNYSSTNNNEDFSILPEISYEAEYYTTMNDKEPVKLESKPDISKTDRDVVNSSSLGSLNPSPNENVNKSTNATVSDFEPFITETETLEGDKENDIEQKQIKTVSKVSKTENKVETQNGDTEAAVVVKLPSKKTAAKTETKVEVEKKVLPDGSIQEIKTTTTTTTIDGKTEVKTTTETTTIPKEEEVEEITEEEEEEEETVGTEIEIEEEKTNEKNTDKQQQVNGSIITQDEKTETSTTRKVTVVQSQESEEEVEEEIKEEVDENVEIEDDVEADVEEVVVIKKQITNTSDSSEEVSSQTQNSEIQNSKEIAVDSNDSVDEDKEIEEESKIEEVDSKVQNNEEEEEEVVEEEEEEVEEEMEEQTEKKDDEEFEECTEDIEEETQHDPSDKEEREIEEEKVNEKESTDAEDQEKSSENLITVDSQNIKESLESNDVPETEKNEVAEKIIPIQHEVTEEVNNNKVLENEKVNLNNVLREPSVPLEKVEDIEIKPIVPSQEIIKKSHTEIITTKTAPPGALSTQTEYNRIENIVTVNRTTKTLDHAYEQAASQTIPIMRTYFPPPQICPQPPNTSYQPSYPTQPEPERRHSLLLDRLSVERQAPVDVYQNNYSYSNQSYEDNQYSLEPQSEVLTESNVKPSLISKNQQWYQQSKQENYTNNITSTPSQDWSQSQPKYQSQPQPQPQPQLQPHYQPQTQTQPLQSQFQPQYTPQSQYQTPYPEVNIKDSYKTTSEDYKQNLYSSYTPKPSWVSSTLEPKHPQSLQSNQYTSLSNKTTESYQNSTQQFNSSYIAPPWEQDAGYTTQSLNQNIYQPPPTFTPTPTPTQQWKTTPPTNKFSKPKPTSYIPPAPNQSFVKPVSTTEQPKNLPGRKTYYSEYERRYISVPESTYIPTETKYQAQPNPSPTYYYDQVEPAEIVEPQWRKELREFTEKTQTTQVTGTSVRPPWEEDLKYGAPKEFSTPTWSQTLRPQSFREKSFESEYTESKEWPKASTLGRPQSFRVTNNMERISERVRGVSVDRYNPNSYQAPYVAEHPPVQSQTLDHNVHPKPHYNPNVSGFPSRASVEPREQPVNPRSRAESRSTPPVQSRSFKYLQWITGTED